MSMIYTIARPMFAAGNDKQEENKVSPEAQQTADAAKANEAAKKDGSKAVVSNGHKCWNITKTVLFSLGIAGLVTTALIATAVLVASIALMTIPGAGTAVGGALAAAAAAVGGAAATAAAFVASHGLPFVIASSVTVAVSTLGVAALGIVWKICNRKPKEKTETEEQKTDANKDATGTDAGTKDATGADAATGDAGAKDATGANADGAEGNAAAAAQATANAGKQAAEGEGKADATAGTPEATATAS